MRNRVTFVVVQKNLSNYENERYRVDKMVYLNIVRNRVLPIIIAIQNVILGLC